MSTVRIAVLAGILLAGQAFAGVPTPEERYQAALTELKKHCDDFCGWGLGKDPAEVAALDALWDATQDWTVAFLGAHPGITAEKLATELLNRRPSDADSIAPQWPVVLAPDLYAFSSQWGETGDAFLIGKRDGHYRVVWDARKADTGEFSMLKAWRTVNARTDCDREGDRRACGPIFGNVYALPAEATGQVRFAVDAIYAQEMGATVGGQISFWRWDGKTAAPLLARNYIIMADDESAVVAANALTLRTKDEYKMFFACGSCSGRQVDWRFRLLPDRVADKEMIVLIPEMDVVDEAFFRLWQHKSITDLATPGVAKLMEGLLETARADLDPKYPKLGMLGEVKADRHGGTTVLTIASDFDRAPQIRVTLVRKNDSWQLIKFRIIREN